MLFVGRKSEKKKIIESLHNGKNIILGGKFGIGRTSLIREIAKILADERKFIFVDFSKTPGEMSEKLMRELDLSARFKKDGNKMGYKSMRYRIANVTSLKKQNTVIVFDNIAKLTNQKIIFLRHLIMESNFQFTAIVENFLSPRDLVRLKAQLLPANVLLLRRLKNDDVISFMRLFSNKHNLNLTDVFIHKMAALTGGYPLGLVNILEKSRFPIFY